MGSFLEGGALAMAENEGVLNGILSMEICAQRGALQKYKDFLRRQ